MYIVKRTKTATPMDVLAPGVALAADGPRHSSTTTVLYATAVAAKGNVAAWTKDRAAAVQITAQEAEVVRGFYRGRTDAGKIEVLSAAWQATPQAKRKREHSAEGGEGQ